MVILFVDYREFAPGHPSAGQLLIIKVNAFHLGLLPNELVESMKALYGYEAKHDPADTGSIAKFGIERGNKAKTVYKPKPLPDSGRKTLECPQR
jgi:hypothetical protein